MNIFLFNINIKWR